jgi:hypothetical protein
MPENIPRRLRKRLVGGAALMGIAVREEKVDDNANDREEEDQETP